MKSTLLLAALTAGLLCGQTKTIPRMPDGKPDLNGIWDHPYVPDMTKDGPNQKGAGALPFTPWGENNFKTYDVSKFDYTGHCLPFGLMRSVNVGGYPIQIVQYGKYLALLFEQNTWFHVVAMGRDHPKDLKPTWYGDSRAHWDGDTLVVDTIGLKDNSWIDMPGHPHTKQMHLTERFHRRDYGNLEIQITIDDPGAYNKPWIQNRAATLETNFEMTEYVCNENNQDPVHLDAGHK